MATPQCSAPSSPGSPPAATPGVHQQLMVVVDAECPQCGEARRLATVAQQRYPALTVQVLDLSVCPDARPRVVFAVPTFLLDGQVFSLGNPDEAHMLRRLAQALG